MRSLPALSESNPSGPDLEYDPAFMALEALARGKAEQQFGETLVAAEPPNWKGVLDHCDNLLTRTRDLRVAVYRARALTSLNGLEGAADGYALIKNLIAEFWGDLHPQLDAEDDNDPTMRINALAALVDPVNYLRELRNATWLRARGAQCNVRQALIALGVGEPSTDAGISQAEIAAMIGALNPQERINWARDALTSVDAMRELLSQTLGAEWVPDFKPLQALLKPLADFFDQDNNLTSEAQNPREGDAMSSIPVALNSSQTASAELRSREDVVRLLDRACQYLERHEPSNPAPLLIRRAQRLLTMNFLDIMKDLAPDAVPTVENIAGMTHNNDSND